MRTGLLAVILLCMACGGNGDAPPARVGTGPEANPDGALLTENKLIAEREARDIDGWIGRHGFTMRATGTGVRYALIVDSAGTNARPGQMARVDFVVSLINGTKCYSSDGRPQEFRIEEDNVESGLHEAIQFMSPGDSAIIVIPSHRAYGLIGDQDRIPPRSTVIYNIKLLGLR